MLCYENIYFICLFYPFLIFVLWLILLPSPLLSALHLWRVADEDSTSKSLMNKAGVMKRQKLHEHELLCLLCFEGPSISRRTLTQSLFKDDFTQKRHDVTSYLIVTHTEMINL